MHLPTLRARRALTTSTLDHRLAQPHPRKVATEWLRDKTRDHHAGLDPYDPSVFILVASRNERVWAIRALELVGLVLTRFDQPGGNVRFRAILEADTRISLGLHQPEPPLMLDEPLASRSVEATHADELMRATFAALPDPEPASRAAMRLAFDAWAERRLPLMDANSDNPLEASIARLRSDNHDRDGVA